jgi:hypothetical protein
MDEVQRGWHDLRLRVSQLEAERLALEHENKALRSLLERAIEHRQKSHSELVLLLTGLVSKLPINDVGVLISRLVEHNAGVAQFLEVIGKTSPGTALAHPSILRSLDQAKRDLNTAIQLAVQEFVQLDPPFEPDLLKAIAEQPAAFFAPRMLRANRSFLKGQVPRERILKEFGEPALALFNDLTTDPKLNPRPKPDEIVLGFKPDFETLVPQAGGLGADHQAGLLALYQKVQRSKAPTDVARAQRTVFQRLSFLSELLYFYEHSNTEPPDVLFAQRLPALIEQLVLVGTSEALDEKSIALAEGLLGFIVSPDHRQAVINNIGKGGGPGKTLRLVLKLRSDKVPDLDHVLAEFLRHLVPGSPQKPPPPPQLAAFLRLIHPDMQRLTLKSLLRYERLPREQASALARAVATDLGMTGFEAHAKAQETVPVEVERQLAWAKIKDLIARRVDPTVVAGAIRERLNAKYDAEEIRASWLTLTEADPLSLIKIFCQMPYLANGKTDSIARTVMETYVTRLMHEKYAAIYKKVTNSLRSMFHAKPDSPTLVNFVALVRWVDPASAARLCGDIGMPAHS